MPSVASAATFLKRLKDVLVTSPTDGEVLAYNNTDSKWENASGGGGSSPETADLTSTPVTSASDTTIEFGGGGPAFTVSRWLDSNGTRHSSGSPTWLDMTDPTTPLLAAGTYLISLRVSANGAVTAATSVQLLLEVNLGGGVKPVVPGSADGSTTPVDATDTSPVWQMVTPYQHAGVSPGTLLGVIQVGSGVSGNLGTVDYTADFVVTKVA